VRRNPSRRHRGPSPSTRTAQSFRRRSIGDLPGPRQGLDRSLTGPAPAAGQGCERRGPDGGRAQPPPGPPPDEESPDEQDAPRAGRTHKGRAAGASAVH
jgi:hypothetical protein